MEEQKEREALKALIAGVMPGRENALVFGEGPQNPKLMLIGEAPGEQESLQGRPFVGKAGKNLDHFLELAGLARPKFCAKACFKAAKCIIETKGLSFPANL